MHVHKVCVREREGEREREREGERERERKRDREREFACQCAPDTYIRLSSPGMCVCLCMCVYVCVIVCNNIHKNTRHIYKTVYVDEVSGIRRLQILAALEEN